MGNFLIGVDYDVVSGAYVANFFEGQSILLGATNFHDAVLEADLLQPEEYEVGYN